MDERSRNDVAKQGDSGTDGGTMTLEFALASLQWVSELTDDELSFGDDTDKRALRTVLAYAGAHQWCVSNSAGYHPHVQGRGCCVAWRTSPGHIVESSGRDLVAAVERAKSRPVESYRKKDWAACPYAAHADDCVCNGMAGDR
jgi:hypothetical protein